LLDFGWKLKAKFLENTTSKSVDTTIAPVLTTQAPVQTTQALKQDTTQVVVSDVNDPIVYWLPNGSVYHTDRNCSYIKDKSNVISGPLSQCPISKKCSRCP
jgi:hypothetical protein